MRKIRVGLAAAAAVALALVGSTTANADELSDADTGDIVMMYEVDGQLFPAEPVYPQTDSNGQASSSPDTVVPYLIDFPQWVSCFSLNNAQSNPYASYTVYNDGDQYDFNLRCGEHFGPNSGWGYKHIRAEHEKDWQKLYDSAKGTGWVPEEQGIEGWDDLMAAGTGMATSFWRYANLQKPNNKGCIIGNVAWYNTKTWKKVIETSVLVSFARDSDRLITSYPVEMSRLKC